MVTISDMRDMMMSGLGVHAQALHDSIKDAPLLERDKAAVILAMRYAHLLDASVSHGTSDLLYESDIMEKLGPKYLAVLNALGLTPAGRGVKGAGSNDNPGAQVTDELRAARARRRGAGFDPAAPVD
jgi:hypothetical protein